MSKTIDQLATSTDGNGLSIVAGDLATKLLKSFPVSVLAKVASPAFTGMPTAPTPANATNSTQLATTAFVKAVIADLVNGAPQLLDTLKEIADQITTDEGAAAALTTLVGQKLNSSSFTGSAVVTLLAALTGAARLDITAIQNAGINFPLYSENSSNPFTIMDVIINGETVKQVGISSAWLSAQVGSGGGSGNTTPAAPTINADDTANTLQATHALGTTEILISVNGAAYAQYDGAVINVGDVARAAGYWKFKIKAATGRNESSEAVSPAFTVASGGGGGTTPAVYSFSGADQVVALANPSTLQLPLNQQWTIGFRAALVDNTGSLSIGFYTGNTRIIQLRLVLAGGNIRMDAAILDATTASYKYTYCTLGNTTYNVLRNYTIMWDGSNLRCFDGATDYSVVADSGTVTSLAAVTDVNVGYSPSNGTSNKSKIDNLSIMKNFNLNGTQLAELVTANMDTRGLSFESYVTSFYGFDSNLNDSKNAHNGSATTPQYV